jgi:ABC-type uncharacterized transport system permease subunit
MDTTLLTIITVALYFAISAYQYWLLKKQDQTHIKRVALMAILPLLLHGYQLHLLIDTGAGQNLSMLNLFSMLFWLIGIALVISSLLKKLEILVLAVFPISAQVALLAGLSTNVYIIDASDPGFLIHILIAIGAVSILGLAAIQSVFVTILDNKLRAQPTRMNLALPPLQDMERFLYFLVIAGFALLTLAIITAIVFMPSSGGEVALHKPVLSTLSWLVLGTFIYGHYRYGWRGKKAAHWTLTGFILLFLAYFGTRTVLEFILG